MSKEKQQLLKMVKNYLEHHCGAAAEINIKISENGHIDFNAVSNTSLSFDDAGDCEELNEDSVDDNFATNKIPVAPISVPTPAPAPAPAPVMEPAPVFREPPVFNNAPSTYDGRETAPDYSNAINRIYEPQLEEPVPAPDYSNGTPSLDDILSTM